ncbi:relaxase/mobilization nuclease domain-containing protein [Flavobacterium sp. HBTb2-11-1]|uniref:relaxase/mobilization nuclease domain-containing protein n=1 Tax=Flavobacterium sp. HBTb2-11-1 TaxID=2692212 RepID=UPI00136EF981|nr:relaxase/mobilization nuclease domain-containing protein [Flavobacterium sp. HBTb2-11-1]MXO04381.1 relaxase/mobilization nuclease domain-containing protein [Flavobacterium sp. HBTb2-11-1]
MVSIIKTGNSIRSIFNYNENKVKTGKAECIGAANFLLDISQMSDAMKLSRFTERIQLNDNTKRNIVHISLNFDPSENHSKEKLMAIANTYMYKIGFGKQPYLVYQHFDAGHPHIHVITINIERDGKRIDLHHLGIRKSEPARKEIEETFRLIKAESLNKNKQFNLLPISMGKVCYGKIESKKALAAVLNQVLYSYRYSSLAELNAVLQCYNVLADRGSENSKVFLNKGIVYRILNEKGIPTGVPIKASDFYFKPTLKFLESKFISNKPRKESDKARLKNVIDMAILRENINNVNQLSLFLEKEGIKTVFRTSSEGLVYGITYIDHTTKNVFNGSSLGKKYSAKAIIGRCGNEFNLDKRDWINKRLETFSSENASVKTFDSSVIIQLLDSILKPEMTLEYLPKQFKKKKRNRRKI